MNHFLTMTQNDLKMLNVAFLNVCSLRRKVQEVQQLISSRGIHVMGLAETWLTDSTTDGEVDIPHFNIYRKDRPGSSRGGGVALYCHESLSVRRRVDLEKDALELLWIEVASGSSKHLIGCCYRPPNERTLYWNDLETNLTFAMEQRLESLSLIGDFNVDMLTTHTAEYKHLYSLCSTFDFTNFVQSPTRVTAQSSTLLDLFLSTAPINSQCEVLPVDISDHFAILTHFAMSRPAQRRAGKFATRQLCKVDWTLFNQELAIHLNSVPSDGSVDDLAFTFVHSIHTVLDRHAPIVVRRHKPRRPCPWTTTGLIGLVRERNRLFHLLTRDRGNTGLEEQHRAARAAARRLDRKLKNAYFVERCSTRDQRKLWAIMNLVTGRKKIKQTPKASLQQLCEAFGEVVTDHNRPSHLILPAGPAIAHGLSDFANVSVHDITELLQTVDPAKATGSDSIPGLVLRMCADTIAPLLTHICNASIMAGDVPACFKMSHVSPLLKGGDASLPSNYRPISLLPIASRLMESVVKVQLTSYLSTNNLYPPSQFAYRRHHSTEDALVLAVNRWLVAKSDSKVTGVIMVDLSKAFDRVCHDLLLAQLFSLGITGNALRWFESYLSNRHQQVKIGTKFSDVVKCTRGVPQGSVLGPILFLLYTSGLDSILPHGVTHQEFADDIVIDFSHRDPAAVSAKLTEAMTSLSKWLDGLGLLINTKKTQVMYIKPRGMTEVSGTVQCNGETLSVVPKVKYLGIFIDDDLRWSSHVDHLARKSGKLTAQLWRHGSSLTVSARRTWYVSMLQSSLCYASTCFFPGLSAGSLDRLTKLSKAGVRSVLRVHNPIATAPLLARLDLKPLVFLYVQKVIMFVFRCMHGLSSALLSPLFRLSAASLADTSIVRRTRGQSSHLLIVPFLTGPAGRQSILFVGSVLWNQLPSCARCLGSRDVFHSTLIKQPLQNFSLR